MLRKRPAEGTANLVYLERPAYLGDGSQNLESAEPQSAASTGKRRTDFILEAARRAAEEALLDRAHRVVQEAADLLGDRSDPIATAVAEPER
jgi:hypothetical protein